MSADPRHIDRLIAQNVAIEDHARVVVIVSDGEVELPSRAELVAYLRAVQTATARWADRPDEPDPPLARQTPDPTGGPDAFIDVQARPLRLTPARGGHTLSAGERAVVAFPAVDHRERSEP